SLAKTKGISVYEIAIAYVINQKFPVVALVGAESPEEVITNTKAGSLTLTTEEINWLSLIK
ncbi:MAG: aldo/keto reductase, partial [Woeseiaceae bacterium]